MKALPKPVTALILLAGMGLASTAQADLIDRGFAVYDTDLNIYWMKNANAAGPMNWQAAKDWAAGLTIGGSTGWRLPTADTVCGNKFNCVNSELGHLYYVELGVTQGNKITSSTNTNFGLFTNVQDLGYWTSTPDAASPTTLAWYFNTLNGRQGSFNQGSFNYAWAVHSGDITIVPEPGVLGLLGVGALAWAGTKARRRG